MVRVAPDQRQVLQVAVLAVAVGQAREDAQHLQVALQAHPLEVAPEQAEVLLHRHAGLARALPVARGPVDLDGFIPLDVGVAQQRDHVVGHRAPDRVLEVENAGPGRVALGVHHQVAAVEVAVHQHGRLGLAGLQDQLEALLQLFLLPGVQRHAAVARDIPLGEEVELAAQQRAVVGRHLRLRVDLLQPDQRVERAAVQGVGRLQALAGGEVLRLQLGQQRARAQVGQQQEALRLVPGQHLGRVQPGRAQQAGDLHEGAAVLVAGRRVHDDQAAAGAVGRIDAEIAAEARVGAGRAHAGGVQAMRGGLHGQPLREGRAARVIAPGDLGGGGRRSGRGGQGIGGGHGRNGAA